MFFGYDMSVCDVAVTTTRLNTMLHNKITTTSSFSFSCVQQTVTVRQHYNMDADDDDDEEDNEKEEEEVCCCTAAANAKMIRRRRRTDEDTR